MRTWNKNEQAAKRGVDFSFLTPAQDPDIEVASSAELSL